MCTFLFGGSIIETSYFARNAMEYRGYKLRALQGMQ